MDFSLHPDVAVRLERDGAVVGVSAEQLTELVAGRMTHALDPGTMKVLFENGMLKPLGVPSAAADPHWRSLLAERTLSPHLRVELRFVADDVQLSGDEPIVGIFHAPIVSAISQGVRAVIRTCVNRVAITSLATRTLPPRLAMDELVQREVGRWLRSTGRSMDDVASSRRATPDERWSTIVVVSGRHAANEVAVPVDALPGLGTALRSLIDRDVDAFTLATSSLHVRRVVAAIEEVGGLVDRVDAPEPAGSDGAAEALSATHLGHAGLLIDAGQTRVVVDPWLFPADDQFVIRPLMASQLGGIDAICLTHHHADHLDIASLLTLPHDVPVLVPASTGAALEPQVADFLHVLGFVDVREIPHGGVVALDDGLEIEALPFHGEGRDHLGFGASCYLFWRAGRSVLIHADASPDSHGASMLSDGALRGVVERRGPIDVVFGTWWQERTFRWSLSPYAVVSPAIPPSSWLDDNEVCDCPPEFVAELLETAGSKLLVTYAEGGPDCFRDLDDKSPYRAAVSLQWASPTFVAEVIRRRSGARLVEARPHLRVVVPVDGQAHVED